MTSEEKWNLFKNGKPRKWDESRKVIVLDDFMDFLLRDGNAAGTDDVVSQGEKSGAMIYRQALADLECKEIGS